MFLYVSWRLNPQIEDIIVPLRISREKEHNVKYLVSRLKYVLCKKEIDANFNVNTIYYTRVNVGKLKSNDNVILGNIVKTYNQQTGNLIINISLCKVQSVRTTIIKNHIKSLFNYVPNDNVEDDYVENSYKKYLKMIDNIVKNVNKNLLHEGMDKNDLPYSIMNTSYPFEPLQLIQGENIELEEDEVYRVPGQPIDFESEEDEIY